MNISKRTSLLLLLLATLMASCDNNSNSNTPSPMSPDSLSGYLISMHVVMDSSYFTGASEDQYVIAGFSATPGDTEGILVDSLTVNGGDVNINQDSNGYFDMLISNVAFDMSSTCTWRVVGNSSIPSFTYNYPVPYPSMSGSLPDTVSRTAGVTFSLVFSGADSVSIEFESDTLGNNIGKAFAPGSTTQTFSSTDLNGLLPSSQFGFKSLMHINVHKSVMQTFNNKNFLFSKVLSYTSAVWIQ